MNYRTFYQTKVESKVGKEVTFADIFSKVAAAEASEIGYMLESFKGWRDKDATHCNQSFEEFR